jgi:hypothetical protein
MKLQLISALLFVSAGAANATTSFGDSSSAVATQTIVHKLQIQKISDLNFGEASPGDGAKTVLAGNSENRENASFEIRGEPTRGFQIILPARNSVKMVTGNGGGNREIVIQDFSSTPSSGGALDSNGKSMIYVGATRAAISDNQKTGEYVGQFYVTVVY